MEGSLDSCSVSCDESGLEDCIINCEDEERLSVVDVTDYDRVKVSLKRRLRSSVRSIIYSITLGVAIAADARDYEVSHWKAVVDELDGSDSRCDVAYKIMAK